MQIGLENDYLAQLALRSMIDDILVSKCQAFMLQYKDMQHSRRNEPKSSRVPKHKKFDRIQDKIQSLKYESEWIDMFNKFNSDPLPPQDGMFTIVT